MSKIVFALLGLCLCFDLRAQQAEEEWEQQLEQQAMQSSESVDDDRGLWDLYEAYRRHPLNINEAGFEELAALQLLSPFQIRQLILYRRLLGNLVSLYELQAIPGWDLTTIRKLLPLIRVSEPSGLRQLWWPGLAAAEKMLIMRTVRHLEKAEGYRREGGYPGDPWQLLLQYRAAFRDIVQYGFTAEKDAGERISRKTGGFDFYSAHFFGRGKGLVKALALGDYSVNLGQGLIQWHSLGFQKSAEVLSIKRESPVLRPYRSAGESYFFRGAAITLRRSRMELSLFASMRRWSASLGEDSTKEEIRSFRSSGLHRTPSELLHRNNVLIRSAGSSLQYRGVSGHCGWNTVVHGFSAPLSPGGDLYQQFRARGSGWWNTSLDYSYTYNNLHLFGEAALSPGNHPALIQGLLLSADPRVDFSVLYRNIAPAYQSLYGHAFTDNSLPSNEKGLYAGLHLRLGARWRLQAYADLCSFPWLRYRVAAPSKADEQLVQVSFQPAKATTMIVRYRVSHRPGPLQNGPLNAVQKEETQNFRVHFSSRLNPIFELRGRVELLWFERGKAGAEEGFLAYLEGKLGPWRGASCSVRWQYFETEGSHSPVYAYESDILYNNSIGKFSGKGYRCYVNIRKDLGDRWSCWIRWAVLLQPGADEIGSGMERTAGGRRREIKGQLRYLF